MTTASKGAEMSRGQALLIAVSIGFLILGPVRGWVQEHTKPAPATPVYVGLDLLNCSDFSGPVWVGNYDPNHLDADHDGIGCEYP